MASDRANQMHMTIVNKGGVRVADKVVVVLAAAAAAEEEEAVAEEAGKGKELVIIMSLLMITAIFEVEVEVELGRSCSERPIVVVFVAAARPEIAVMVLLAF